MVILFIVFEVNHDTHIFYWPLSTFPLRKIVHIQGSSNTQALHQYHAHSPLFFHTTHLHYFFRQSLNQHHTHQERS